MKLESHVSGRWQAGAGEGRALVNPVTGAVLATADASGIDLAAGLAFARERGGPALRAMSFAARGAMLKAIADVLAANRTEYDGIARDNSGNTRADAAIDIDGAIGTLRFYARLGAGLGEARAILEPGQDQLAREPVFFARHLWSSRPGVAVSINAYNFPAWGMWEKAAVALLAGAPVFAKPATPTALLAWRMMRDVIAAKVAPEGALSLLCGGGEGLAGALGPMDSLAFTGSAETGRVLRADARIIASGARLTIEADSVNATILGPDAAPGTAMFDLALREAEKALSVKAGQLCTNIRRILVPEAIAPAFAEALAEKVRAFRVGDPADEATRVGPLVNRAEQQVAERRIAMLRSEATCLAEAQRPTSGAFVAPTLLHCAAPEAARHVHEIEVFGPCATILPYGTLTGATRLAARAGGSLALSLFSDDPATQLQVIADAAPWHGRVLLVDAEVGKAHTGHAIVMPQCVHGGPGRAGGGEELGGLRALGFYHQRSAVQAPGEVLARLVEGAAPWQGGAG